MDKERVLAVGTEGGGASVFRTPLGTGVWQFHIEGTSIGMDDNDNEEWRSWQSKPFQTIEEAVRSISANGDWLFFYPTSIHPDYRTAVWNLVQETLPILPDERRTRWAERMRDRWQNRCRVDQLGYP